MKVMDLALQRVAKLTISNFETASIIPKKGELSQNMKRRLRIGMKERTTRESTTDGKAFPPPHAIVPNLAPTTSLLHSSLNEKWRFFFCSRE